MARRRLAGRTAAVLGGGLLFLLWLLGGPIPPIDPSAHTSMTILDRNGELLYEPLSSTGTRAEWLTASQLPPNVVNATTAAEDRRFFRHPGVDPLSIARAAIHDARAMRFVEGGSTITQQVAKLLLDNPRRTLGAKLHEAVIALRLERRLTKREILALYLNLAPYGNQTHGIARASRRYFGCRPEDLTVAQAAFLASLPQRPTAFNPLRDQRAAVARQRRILQLMTLTQAERATAVAERLRFDRGDRSLIAQHFIENVGRTLQSARGGLENPPYIHTTLDAHLQRQVQGIIAAQRETLLAHGAHSVAVAVLDNASGEWLAWEGSGDYFGTDFGGAIDGVVALRQPGSTLKPFTYALAFENGFTPATVLPDVESHFPTAQEGIVYSPRNYDGRFRGPLRARAALAGSENVPAVALLSRLGAPSLLRLLRDLGFRDLDKTADYYGLGLTLGDAEVRLDQLVAAYSVFARGGTYIQPTMLRRHPTPDTRHLLSPRTAFWITDILSDPDAREFIFGSGGSLDFPFPVAVKTGTSQAYRDNWTIGYTRDVTVGVWVGNFDREELRNSSGVTGAGPIFHAVMLAASRRSEAPIADRPPTLERRSICLVSGLRPSPSCSTVGEEWVPAGAPVQFCSWHHDGWTDWPPEYRAWAAKSFPVPPPPTLHATRLRVTSPPNGATYLIDPTLRREYQAVFLRATSRTPLTWHVDEKRIGTAAPDHAVEWPLQPGRHVVTAVDAEGNRDSVKIYVK